ncbi:MAG: DUF58 domain-containing protein [Candidatus Kapabacteria bacterium]|nr:DUF58 domain-containing protein [Candidatus Kapabacteria bacterium]
MNIVTIIKHFVASFYFTTYYYAAIGIVAVIQLIAFFIEWLQFPAQILFVALLVYPVMDALMLYLPKFGIKARRDTPDRLSNGDDNPISIHIENNYGFNTTIHIIDEIPHQFQQRNINFDTTLSAGEQKVISYKLRPTERGEYSFGAVNIFIESPLRAVQRKVSFSNNAMVPVYPSYIQMRKYELLAATNRLVDVGIKKIRRAGHAKEFDQIREYIPGDEYRTINWNATARKGQLMVNQYQDEKSQHVYSLIDMGRTMKMPFERLTLLDYAINASLVISNIAMHKDDKAGLITFTENIESLLKADKGKGQLRKILDTLYNQETRFRESNYEMLYTTVRRQIHQRSLLLLFTNFETHSSMKRQLKYFSMLAKSHLLCVIFFENTELNTLLTTPPRTLADIYIKTIGEKFAYEKKLITSELERHGIQCIFTPPQNLTVNTINKYLELKAKGMI